MAHEIKDTSIRQIQGEAEREQLLAETTALYNGSQAIAKALSERQIFDALFEQIRPHRPCEISAFRFHLVDDEPIWIELVANWQKQNTPTYPEKTRLYLPEFLHARLLTTNKPIFIDDIATDSRLSAEEQASFAPTGAASVALLPLMASGQKFGVILVYFTRPYIFIKTIQRLWIALMDQASVSLINQQFIQKSAYRAVQMDTAAEVARVASSILNVQDLLGSTVALVQDRFDLYYVEVFLVDAAKEWAVLKAGTGEAGRIQLEKGHRLRIGGESMIGWSIQNRQARIALDVGKDAVHFQNPDLPETRSEMALPLIHRSEVVGALTIQSTEQAAFSREDIVFLQTMADQLAVAVENARLFTAARESEATTRALLNAIPDLMFRINKYGVYLDVKGSREISTVIPHEEFVGKNLRDVLPPEVAQERLQYIKKALKSNQPQTFEYDLSIRGKAHHFESRIVGCGEDEVLTIIRDITKQQQATKIRDSSYRISEAANSAKNLNEFFESVHGVIGELMPAKNFYIALYNDATQTITFPYFVDEHDPPPSLEPHPLGSGAIEYVLRTGTPLLASQEDFSKLEEEIEFMGSSSADWLGTPLKTHDKTVGVLVVQSYTKGVRYDDEAKNILTFVSNQVAMAIDRKRSEEALLVSETKYRELVENANSIIFRMNIHGEVTFFNEFAQRFFGYSEEEIIGCNVVGTIVPTTDTSGQDLATMINDIIRRPERYASNENENIRRNGERVWVTWTNRAIFDRNHRFTEILCVGNDITERKQAEQSLSNSEALYSSLVESLPQNIFRKDLNGRFTFANQRYLVNLGKSLEELVGKTDFDLYPGERAEKHLLDDRQVIETEQTLEAIEEQKTAAGEVRYVRIVKTPSYNADGQIIGIQGISWDITERRQMEEVLARRERYMVALVEIQTQLLAYYRIEDYYPKILEVLGKASGASRIYIFENHEDALGMLLMSQRSEWCAEGIEPQIDNPDLQNLSYEEFFPRWAKTMEQGEIISGAVADFPTSERVILDPQGILAILVLPLIVNGEFVGFMGFDNCVTPHTWEQSEIDLLRIAAAAVGRWHERKLARETLSQERNLLRTLIDNLPDYVFVKDQKSRFVLNNTAHLRVLGATAQEEVLGKTDFDIFPEELASQYYADEQNIIQTGHPLINREEETTSPKNDRQWLLTTKVPLQDNQGRVTGLVGVGHDITERKLAEKTLEEALRRSQLLYNISEALTAITDQQAALETILGEYLLLLKLERGSISLFDPATGYNQVQAQYLDNKVTQPEFSIEATRDLITQHLSKNPFPLVIDDVQTHPLTRNNQQVPDSVAGMLLIPLIARGEVVGLMSAETTEKDHVFSQEDIEAGKAIGDQLAIWLENRQLLEETQYRSNLLVTGAQVSGAASSILDPNELINTTVNLIRDQFDFYYVGLFLVDDVRQWAVLRAGTGEAGRIQVEKGHRLEIGGESMIGWSVANRQARIALDVGEEAVHFQNPNLPDTRSEMALPLISRDEVIGALTVQSIKQNAFSSEDITVLQTMADQLANAIANARLFGNVVRSQKAAESLLQETQALQQLSQALAGTLRADEILDLFFDACTQEIGFEYVVLSMVDQQKDEVKSVAAVGISEEQFKQSRLSLDSTDIIADIVRTGKTEVITGWNDRFDSGMFTSEEHTNWIRLFTPIVLRRDNVGLVEAGFNMNTRTTIEDSQIRLLRAFIDQTALALDNAQRYEGSQKAARREALIKEITTKVRASTDLDNILRTTVKEIGDAIESKRTYVHLISPTNGETETRD